MAVIRAKCHAVNNRASLGFTLLELLIVMLIISVSLSWGGYHWGQYQNRLRLQSAVNNVLSFMERQQALANYLNQERTLWLVAGQSWCLISSDTRQSDCSDGNNNDGNNSNGGNNGNSERVTSPHHDVFLSSSTTERIDFYGVRNTAMPASFILENAAGEISVVVSGRGRIRTCSNTISQLPGCEGIKNVRE
ncbi:prepilin peptidase-dependent protein [Xenorhabdus szentirmaii]|uniref:prepilin peptidase-dependent protein n=1 Tax=Xenorhabdus szentirmaii TaxID=290112 RepID=UPI001986518C|nr:prepilin peptidase-dependent protein [Xenorhabdus sp. 38]MBD2781036.1 prepilin peptidase-dependent protein [Xenorhabdus sp. 38]